jgi:hypothetical protein
MFLLVSFRTITRVTIMRKHVWFSKVGYFCEFPQKYDSFLNIQNPFEEMFQAQIKVGILHYERKFVLFKI